LNELYLIDLLYIMLFYNDMVMMRYRVLLVDAVYAYTCVYL